MSEVCMDACEATVWRVPNPATMNAPLVRKIQLGKASRADLTAAGATRLGAGADDDAPCERNGRNGSGDIFAVSLPSEIPSAFAAWFRAQEACADNGKRLPTNAAWQVGASGTPDPGTEIGAEDGTVIDDPPSPTGDRAGRVSARGAFDLAGNMAERVAGWAAAPSAFPGRAGFRDDAMCLARASATRNATGALVRGGASAALGDPGAGPLSIVAVPPFGTAIFIAFRCVRRAELR